ncbi:hypothetical protein NIES4071_37840 [Calothrix sp. NIES-4071]|nr:hypothetical protein NIES4071_37840 [Calothrix sp. NIES-4071]BAZ58101.1 hypothetical protein NIES4105_37770 [Calothrix sp. NIES-4105]
MFDLKETTLNQVNDTAISLEKSYRIAHEIPGRIRFSIPKLATDSDYADKLKALIESDSKVTDVRLNQKAGSIAISYQSDLNTGDQIRTHLVNLIDKNAPAYVPVTRAITLYEESTHFLEENKIGAVLTNIKNVVLIIVGSMSLVIGVIGVILPLLPGTPFLILSTFCFSQVEW